MLKMTPTKQYDGVGKGIFQGDRDISEYYGSGLIKKGLWILPGEKEVAKEFYQRINDKPVKVLERYHEMFLVPAIDGLEYHEWSSEARSKYMAVHRDILENREEAVGSEKIKRNAIDKMVLGSIIFDQLIEMDSRGELR